MPTLPSRDGAGGMAWVFAGSDPDTGHSGGSNWSSLIGIVTAIIGNILIALALNVQRYSHIQLRRRRVEVRERAKEAMKNVENARRNGYGTTQDPSDSAEPGDEEESNSPEETHPLAQSFQSGDSNATDRSGDESKVASTYLKSPSWWLGQVLMTVGEMGNFLAYGFAPASIVSPLGVVALISNCIIAPIFFGEAFRKRDFWGVVIAVAGAVTVVLSAKQKETKLEPHDVWDAITTLEFEIYMAITIFLIVVFMWASPRYGNRTILIDLGLVGLFGGYTALTTKGVSSMLSSTLFRAFTTPVTYGLIIVLLSTAVMQVRYVNKALQRFDSTQVIPIQFVLFTLFVIIGSAVLYRDFERTTGQQAAKFVGGCLLTFFGVFLITSGRPHHNDEDDLSDDENVEETIGLTEQENVGPYADAVDQSASGQQQTLSSPSSRRSSHTSRVSFAHGGIRPLTVTSDTGTPRKPVASTSRTSLAKPVETAPLLGNPWKNSVERGSHPGLPPTLSQDSVATIHSVTSVAVSEPAQSSTSLPAGLGSPTSPSRPSTPRASVSLSRPHSNHYSNTFISPSPLSSTVSAVVADALLRGEDSPLGRRKSMRRSRPSVRSSIFVPQNEDEMSPIIEPRLGSSSEGDLIQAQGDGPAGDPKTIRGRARSLSNTLEEFFKRKRRGRGNSDPEGGEHTSGVAVSSGHHENASTVAPEN
ncbi:DUF803-domain-containing protein [Xylariomycetidae sp. FL2044]|nr:DUF803-domain-containing protein [Xylariomycetidae sp. FL2044]